MNIEHIFFYIINYKPIIDYKIYLKNKFLYNIYCKNFFLFFLLINFFKYNKKIKIIIRKNFFYSIFYLRAPNRFKKSQIKLNLLRYKVILKFNKNYNFEISNKFNFIYFIIYFINYFLYIYIYIESSLFFLENKKVIINIYNNIFINNIN